MKLVLLVRSLLVTFVIYPLITFSLCFVADRLLSLRSANRAGGGRALARGRTQHRRSASPFQIGSIPVCNPNRSSAGTRGDPWSTPCLAEGSLASSNASLAQRRATESLTTYSNPGSDCFGPQFAAGACSRRHADHTRGIASALAR